MQRFLPAAVALLATTIHAQESKVPAALPHMSDVKTSAIPHVSEGSFTRAGEAIAPAARSLPTANGDLAPRVPTFPRYDTDEAGRIWVRGSNYKASFGAEGATFIPFLGSQAPRNHPVAMRVSTVTAGGEALSFASTPTTELVGDRVDMRRGAFTEQYVIGRDSIEQRFVFDTLPTRGELVVTIDVESELAGRSDAEGFRFENELGHVSYGRAVAIDAHGRKQAVAASLVDSRIALTVPAAFLATAELPLVIDPLVGTFAVTNQAGNQWRPDVAYDLSTNSILVVYEDEFSATDHDVFGEKYVDQIYQGNVDVDFTTDDWRTPKVANNNIANQFLCVAAVGATGSRIIRGRTISAGSLTTGVQFTISGSEVGDLHDPDVGGDPSSAAPTYYCTVWQRDFSATDTDVLGRLVLSNSTLLGSSTIFIENSSATLDALPSISKTDGLAPASTQDWNLVWEHATSSTNKDVYGAQIHWDGTITSPTFIVASTLGNESQPCASEPLNDSPAGRPWLAAYRIDTGSTYDLRTRAFNGTSTVGTYDVTALSAFSNAGSPTIATDGHLWEVAYAITSGLFPSLDSNVWATTVAFQGSSLFSTEAPFVVAGSSDDESRPESTSTFSSGNPYRTYIAYDKYTAANGYDVFVGVHDSVVNAGLTAYCFGTAANCPCGNGGDGLSGCANSVNANGARLTSTGTAYVSNDSFVLVGTGMPASSTCLYFQATASASSTFGDGLRCAGSGIIRLGTKTNSGGASATGYAIDTQIHTKGLLPAIGGRRYYQVWYRNSAAFCTASTFNLSNGLGVTWLP